MVFSNHSFSFSCSMYSGIVGYDTSIGDPGSNYPRFEGQNYNHYRQQHIYNAGFGQEQFQAFPYPYRSIKVSLIHAFLWQEFSENGNEMMVQNSGRDIFPSLDYSVNGLNPVNNYRMGLKLKRTSTFVLNYNGENKKDMKIPVGWNNSKVSSNNCDEYSNELMSEVKSGNEWMKNEIHWEKLKIYHISQKKKTGQKPKEEMTKEELQVLEENEMMQNAVMLKVQSHQKYLPILTVYEESLDGMRQPVAIFSFPETEFIVVTSYKNSKIKILKAKNNKFVRGDVRRNANQKASEIQKNHSSPMSPIQNPPPSFCPLTSSNNSVSPLSKSLYNPPDHHFQNPMFFSSESQKLRPLANGPLNFPTGVSSTDNNNSVNPNYNFLNSYLNF